MTTTGDRLRSLSLFAPYRLRPQRMIGRLVDRISPDELPGDAVERLQQRVAELLGKPAALLFPTGTMTQQVALRIQADERNRRAIAFHPTCHLELHEHKGYEVVHGLTGRPAGEAERLMTLSDLADIAEPLAALVLELPQREIGGPLPDWDELVAQTSWARERGAAVHMDGARLWLAQPYYGRPHAEIAALFDTVYVSLSKAFPGVGGGMLAGSAELIAHAKVWRDRLGGSMNYAWPTALAGEWALDTYLPRMAEFGQRAREIAAALRDVPRVEVVCDPPQTALFHLHIAASAESVRQAGRDLGEKRDVCFPAYVRPDPTPRACGVEFTVAEQFDDFGTDEVCELIDELARDAQRLDAEEQPG